MKSNDILFVLQRRDMSDLVVVVNAYDRELAKRAAERHLGGNPDNYIVSPVSEPGAKVHIDIIA